MRYEVKELLEKLLTIFCAAKARYGILILQLVPDHRIEGGLVKRGAKTN
jgi:hypothetical protein